MSPEEQVAAVRAALAEVGWTDADVRWEPDIEEISVNTTEDTTDDVYLGAIWRAFSLIDPGNQLCWPCWRTAQDGLVGGWVLIDHCTHDWRVEPWPPVPTPGARDV